ncbi:uncharacterized protein [Cherax quadricarinatus]|uniref:uncharacterized protein n=1 Tax=Cherax quadricarinatus TaxID=27406 RepID=UPI00387E4E18
MRRWCLLLVVLAALVYLLYTGFGAAGSGPGAAGPGTGAAGPGSGAAGPGPGAAGTGAAGPGSGAVGPGPGAAGPGTGAAGPGSGAAGPGPGAAGPGPGAAGPGPGAAGPGIGAAGPGQVITGTGRVPGDKVTTAAALSEKCYQYTGLTAINTCCKMLDYAENNGSNILQCANTSTHTQYLTKQRSSPSAASSVWAGWRGIYPPAAETVATAEERADETDNMGGRGQHWVMLGDSHIRNVFEVLVKRISPRLKYRLTSFRKDEWRDIEHIYEKPWKAYHNETIEVVHLDVPLRLTFYWDPFHQLLSDLLHKWLTPAHRLQVPSVLIISDSVLHWLMRSIVLYTDRDAMDMNNQQDLMHHLRQLNSFSQHITVIFKMQDYIPT